MFKLQSSPPVLGAGKDIVVRQCGGDVQSAEQSWYLCMETNSIQPSVGRLVLLAFVYWRNDEI